MKERQCTECGIVYGHYGQRAKLCKECRREYDRRFYKNRPADKKKRKVDLQLLRLRSVLQKVVTFLKSNPCVKCGEGRIPCLQFDHIKIEDKRENISDMVRHGFAWEEIEKEISKCRVLCANCHAVHTAEQFSWYQGIDL